MADWVVGAHSITAAWWQVKGIPRFNLGIIGIIKARTVQLPVTGGPYSLAINKGDGDLGHNMS